MQHQGRTVGARTAPEPGAASAPGAREGGAQPSRAVQPSSVGEIDNEDGLREVFATASVELDAESDVEGGTACLVRGVGANGSKSLPRTEAARMSFVGNHDGLRPLALVDDCDPSIERGDRQRQGGDYTNTELNGAGSVGFGQPLHRCRGRTLAIPPQAGELSLTSASEPA